MVVGAVEKTTGEHALAVALSPKERAVWGREYHFKKKMFTVLV